MPDPDWLVPDFAGARVDTIDHSNHHGPNACSRAVDADRKLSSLFHLSCCNFEKVRASGLLTFKHIVDIQAELERNNAGSRKLPGTALLGPAFDPAHKKALMTEDPLQQACLGWLADLAASW